MNIQRTVGVFSAGAIVIAAGAAADVTPVAMGEARRADPVCVAGARLKPGGGYERTTPWMPYGGVGVDGDDVPVYDSLDLEGKGGYIFRDDKDQVINIPNTVTNMKMSPEFRGAQCQGADLFYWWTDNGNGNYWFIAIFAAEDVSTDCSLPAFDHAYDGVILGFAPQGTGLWYTPVRNLDAYGLFWRMPTDGAGAWTISFLDGDNEFAKGPAQEVAAGTSNNGGTPGRPGESTDPTWSDRADYGTFDPATECLSYALGLDPDPLSTGIIFWTDDVIPPWYPDCTVDGQLDIFDFLCFMNDFNDDGDYSDCDENGGHDLFDFLCFVNCYNSC